MGMVTLAAQQPSPAQQAEWPIEPQAQSVYLSIESIGKTYGTRGQVETMALKEINLSIAKGEFLAILGPSGCGKSTLLQIIAGLLSSTSGSVKLGQKLVVAPPREMVYLFQQYSKSLLPWRSVRRNVALPLEARGDLSKAEMTERSEHYLAKVGLSGFGKHYPWQLSGGMQQRVAIARALAAEPQVLLLDEPFSAVDALTRIELQELVLDLWQKNGLTVLLITHDVDEAVFMADRIAMLSNRPSVVERCEVVDLPRPRDGLLTRELPRFLELRHELVSHLIREQRRTK
jgi:NitT/TauT family transport system ATP-binding protein